MTRIKRGYIARRRRTKIRLFASSFRGAHSRLTRTPTSGRRAAERGAWSPLYSAGSKTRRRSETKHESSIPLTIRFEPPILFEMLTRFNDADEGNQRKGSQRQARSIGGLIG